MENTKEPRDPHLYVNPVFFWRPPAQIPLRKSYYHSPADQDYLYKAQAVFRPVFLTSYAVGIYNGYMHHGIKKAYPLLAHATMFLWPGITAGGLFITANAVAVKIKGKDTSWCHFWGAFSSVAFLSSWYQLGITWPLAPFVGLIFVRYRYMRGREVNEGIPIYRGESGPFAMQRIPNIISHMLRMEPLYKMPPETPES